MTEAEFLALLRPLATHPAARGLADDAAVLGDLVFTHDVLVEGVHFRAGDAPEDVAWKLLAVNLSDLAAKGAVPVGVLLGYPLSNGDWDERFVAGLGAALGTFDVPLLGGDTVTGPRVLSLTAIGRSAHAPSRSGARAGDALFVTGVIGRAGLGLTLLNAVRPERSRGTGSASAADAPLGTSASTALGTNGDEAACIRAYLRPQPRLAEGQALAPLVHAMMDISDGLLIDAQRMADASGLALAIDLDAVPVARSSVQQADLAELVEAPPSFVAAAEEKKGLRQAQASRRLDEIMAAITAGDDYELLFAAPPSSVLPVPATRIGTFGEGSGLALHNAYGPVALPERLGWQHGI